VDVTEFILTRFIARLTCRLVARDRRRRPALQP
jgi:hypothetical protein